MVEAETIVSLGEIGLTLLTYRRVICVLLRAEKQGNV